MGTNIFVNIGRFNNLDEYKSEIKLEKDSIILRSISEKAISVGGEYLYARLPFVYEVGRNIWKFEDIRHKLEKILNVKNVHITDLLFDCRFVGIYSLEIDIETEGIDDLVSRLFQNEDNIKWPYIREIKFKLSSKENMKLFI